MSTICVDTVFPEFTAIFLAVRELLIRSPNLKFSLPTVPSPLMPDITWPTMNAINISIELMTFSFLNFLYMLINPVLGFISGFGFSLPWPKVPILDIELPDLLSFDMAAIIASIRAKFPDISQFYALIPLLPNPVFGNINIPSLGLVEAIQMLIKSFIVTVAGFVVSIFNIVKGILNQKIFGFFNLSLPEFPTLPTDWASLIGLLGLTVPDLNLQLSLPNVSLEDIFARIQIPGLSLPDFNIMFSDLAAPQITFMQIAKLGFLALVLVLVKLFKSVCDIISGFIGFSFPKICI